LRIGCAPSCPQPRPEARRPRSSRFLARWDNSSPAPELRLQMPKPDAAWAPSHICVQTVDRSRKTAISSPFGFLKWPFDCILCGSKGIRTPDPPVVSCGLWMRLFRSDVSRFLGLSTGQSDFSKTEFTYCAPRFYRLRVVSTSFDVAEVSNKCRPLV